LFYLQIFFVSTDAQMSLPLGFLPMHKINGEKVYLHMKRILDLFRDHTPIDIHWGSSDGFQSHKTFLAQIIKAYPNYVHFFDTVHILKNLRNHLLNKVMTVDKVQFSMKTLCLLKNEDVDHDKRRLYRNLLPHDPIPTDKMNISMVDMLLQPALIRALKTEKEEGKSLGEYFQQMLNLKEGMTDNRLTYPERIAKLDSAEGYFKGLEDSLGDMQLQIRTTVASLKALHKLDPDLVLKPSVFGTLIVENFFSTIRASIRYPSLWEYAIVYSRAWMELVKNNCNDSTYVGPKWKSSFGKCYGNQNGIMFSIDSIKLLNPEERKGKLKAIASQNAGSAEDVKKCETLVHFFKCQKKRMTTREVTCKESPIVVNKKLE